MKLNIKHTSGKVEPIEHGKMKDVEHLKGTSGKMGNFKKSTIDKLAKVGKF